jgi:hypothetical protein
MNKKTGVVVVASTLLLAVVLFTPFAFAQTWPSCTVDAGGTEITVDEAGGFFSFTVKYANPGITNTIILSNPSTGEYIERALESGQEVVVSYSGLKEADVQIDSQGDIAYAGPADSVTVNSIAIPEFPAFLILPLFMAATLMAAIVYRRKRTS